MILKAFRWKIVLDGGDKALNSAWFLSLPKDLVAKLLCFDELLTDEKVVYARVVEWAKRQLELNGRRSDAADIRATLGDVLYLIRFPLFDAKEFADGPALSGILTQEECLSLFHWFVAQSPPSLFCMEAER
ncbi:BTB/POZ domain-containing protein 6 [Aphelenchoides avenae]|nr:BTB/POZ domain-containing protein 6 [Aphelenchus avenae]